MAVLALLVPAPTSGPASISTNRRSKRESSRAIAVPTSPAPTIATSQSRSLLIDPLLRPRSGVVIADRARRTCMALQPARWSDMWRYCSLEAHESRRSPRGGFQAGPSANRVRGDGGATWDRHPPGPVARGEQAAGRAQPRRAPPDLALDASTGPHDPRAERSSGLPTRAYRRHLRRQAAAARGEERQAAWGRG